MKKMFIFCVIIAFGLTMADVHAQVYAELSTSSSTDRGIIREQNISYYEDGNGQGYFVYLPSLSSLTANIVKVPEKWSIHDFRVIGDTAFFCGTDLNDKSALLGHFSIGLLQSGSGTINFRRDNGIRTRMATLNRIAVYKDKASSTVSVMSIGRESTDDPNFAGCDRVVYIDDYAATTRCIFSNPNNPNEQFWDVVLTDNYFVMVGKIKPDSLTMRRVPIGTGLAAFPTLFSNGYKYHCSNELKSGVRATHITNDDIVMAAYLSESSTSEIWMHLFTIDVLPASMNYHQKPYMPLSPYPTGDLLPPRDMVYLPDSTALMVIDTNITSNNSTKSHILRLTPYPIGMPIGSWYVPPYYYYYQSSVIYKKYNSLIKISPTCCMAAAGDKWLMIDLQDPLLPHQINSNTNDCIKSYTIDCFIVATSTAGPINGKSLVTYNKVMTSNTNGVESNVPLFPCSPLNLWLDPNKTDDPIEPTE